MTSKDKRDEASQPAPGADAIIVSNLSYAYPGAAQKALDDVSFTVAEGAVFGLLGPSGAGKSTLQRILTRQIRRYETGSAVVLGRNVNDWGPSFYERIGVGFELPNHYLRLSGRENLVFFASLYQTPTTPVDDLLERVGLADAADARVSEYSKGMQVRLNFCRAILHDPDLVFLDEPTTGLDPTTAARLKNEIRDLKARGKTIILTTHNMYDADELCDRVGFIASGTLTAIDAPRILRERYGDASVDVTAQDGRTERFALDGLGDNAAFAAFLGSGPVRSIHSREASLDDVFRIVTGERLDEDPAGRGGA
ncbi:MAG: ABC transporter ATP-binding protein [Pseudomonadota bacterium]